MKILSTLISFSCALAIGTPAISLAQNRSPFQLLKTIPLPGLKKGFDHFATTASGDRVFSCAEWHKSVEIFDASTGDKIHSIGGLERPHSIFYRDDIDRLYVVDGTETMGAVRIYDGKTYELLKTVELLPDADWIAFDPVTKYLYVTQGGDEIKHDYSIITIVDTTKGEKAGDIAVNGAVIEDLALESGSARMYLGNKTINGIDVIDRQSHAILAHWPLTMGTAVAPLALDERNGRVFAACRSGSNGGQVVVFDTTSGKEVTSMPINDGCDDLLWDPQERRLYATCAGTPKSNGTIDVYKQTDANHYDFVGRTPTGLMARNGLLISQVKRYYVGVPQHAADDAKILVFEPSWESGMP